MYSYILTFNCEKSINGEKFILWLFLVTYSIFRFLLWKMFIGIVSGIWMPILYFDFWLWEIKKSRKSILWLFLDTYSIFWFLIVKNWKSKIYIDIVRNPKIEKNRYSDCFWLLGARLAGSERNMLPHLQQFSFSYHHDHHGIYHNQFSLKLSSWSSFPRIFL